MKRYSEYKDSGIQWIGKIPSHWKIQRAKNMFKKEKRDVRPEDEVITCFRDGQVTLRKNRRTIGFTESFTEYGYQGIRKGDLVIHQMDAFAGSIGVSDSDGKGTSVYHCCTPKGNFDTRYYAFLIRIMAYSGYIQSLYRGIRERSSDFKFPVFGNQDLVVPPFAEQQAVVDYLKVKTSKIEQYVTERERERELLESLKQSEIANVVTHGLNPNVPMKDSGIPWIGMIPRHWSLRRIKYIFIESKERSITGQELSLSLSKDNGIIPSSDKKNKTMESASLVGCKVVRKGDIVFNRFKARLFAVSAYDGVVSSDYAVYKCNETANAEFMVLLLGTEMYREAFNRKASGIGDGFSRLYTEDLFSFYAVFPPLQEQNAIIDYIKRRSDKINNYIADLQSEIDYLKEFKQRLISDVVTGQICVAEPQKGEMQ